MSSQAVTIRFLPNDRVVNATAGDSLLEVAQRSGLQIPTGCMMGSCHACEVEMNGEPVCSCITAVPASEKEIIVDLYSDPVW